MRRLAGQLCVAGWPVRGEDGSIIVPPAFGIAATDTANIQACHDLLPSTGGLVKLRGGVYAINPSSPLSFTKPIHLRGQGGLHPQTQLNFNSATGTAITSTASHCIFEDFGLFNTSGTTPTAGNGISVNATGGGQYNQYRGIEISGFYTNLNHQYGFGWTMRECVIANYIIAGVHIENIDNTDGGDFGIIDCDFYSAASTGAAFNRAIDWNSGGGLRFIGNKINAGVAAGLPSYGLLLNVKDGVNTTVMLIEGNSIENVDIGIAVQQVGPSNTGKLRRIIVTGNEFLMIGTQNCIVVSPSVSGDISEIIVANNIFENGNTGLNVNANVDKIKYGPNIYEGQTTAFSVNATNATQIGGG